MRSFILYRIIAPHGITDLLHAQQTDWTSLIASYGVAFSLILVQPVFPLLMLASVVHFRHDFHFREEWKKMASSCLSLTLFAYCPDLFLVYMTLVHVPHHYQRMWPVLKEDPVNAGILIYAIGHLAQYPLPPIFVQSVILGHIFYSEGSLKHKKLH